MKILRLSWINYKRMAKDINSILFMMIMPIVVITFTYFIVHSDKGIADTTVAFNIKDKGSYSQELLNSLNQTKNVFYDDEEKALELLQKNDVVSIYIIPEDFTEKIKKGEKPIIERLERKESKVVAPIEIRLNNEISHKIKEELLLKEGIIKDKKELSTFSIKSDIKYDKSPISSDLFLAALLIIYFIILSSNTISTEILNQRKEKILQRALTTANRGYEIIASSYLAMFLLQISVYTGVLFISKFIMKYKIVDFHIIFINIALASLVSISLGLFITRIFKNPGIVSMVNTLAVILTTFLSIFSFDDGQTSTMSWVLVNLAKFTPQYWLFNSLENSKLFPNVIVLLLMTLALFTAGNFKLRNFANR